MTAVFSILGAVTLFMAYLIIFEPAWLSILIWRWRHRDGCGHQHFLTLRREVLGSSRILTLHGRILDIADLDIRAKCPKCGRIHRFQVRTASEAHNFSPDDE